MSERITGIALEPHSESLGMSGTEKVWEPEALEEAAETLAGCEIKNSCSLGPAEVIGEVKYAEYSEGEGVYYEAELYDEDAFEVLDAGPTRLAPTMVHEELPRDNEPVEPKEIEFTGLFITSHPSNGVPDNPE